MGDVWGCGNMMEVVDASSMELKKFHRNPCPCLKSTGGINIVIISNIIKMHHTTSQFTCDT